MLQFSRIKLKCFILIFVHLKQILPNMTSVYMWEGDVAQEIEAKLLIKTKSEKMNDVFETIKSLHSYEVPEIQVVDVATGNLAYFHWMDEVLN